jgi:hypothetical protein
MGGSSDLCAMLKAGGAGDPHGPDGSPTHIASGDGDRRARLGRGAVPIGAAFREQGSKVLYFAGYKNSSTLKLAEIEAAADAWCGAATAPGSCPPAPRTALSSGNIVRR